MKFATLSIFCGLLFFSFQAQVDDFLPYGLVRIDQMSNNFKCLDGSSLNEFFKNFKLESQDVDSMAADYEKDGRIKVIGLGGNGVVFNVKYKNKDAVIKLVVPDSENLNVINLPDPDTLFLSLFRDNWLFNHLIMSYRMNQNFVLALEFAKFGDLLNYKNALSSKYYNKCFNEIVRQIFYRLLTALEHMHSMGVIHRDLKLENILVDENQNAIIGDLGYACIGSNNVPCGSYHTMAPEVSDGRAYDESCDLYSLAATIYMFVTSEDYNPKIELQLQSCVERFGILGSLLYDMLKQDPRERLSDIPSIKKHEYFHGLDTNIITKRPNCEPNKLEIYFSKLQFKDFKFSASFNNAFYTIENFSMIMHYTLFEFHEEFELANDVAKNLFKGNKYFIQPYFFLPMGKLIFHEILGSSFNEYFSKLIYDYYVEVEELYLWDFTDIEINNKKKELDAFLEVYKARLIYSIGFALKYAELKGYEVKNDFSQIILSVSVKGYIQFSAFKNFQKKLPNSPNLNLEFFKFMYRVIYNNDGINSLNSLDSFLGNAQDLSTEKWPNLPYVELKF